MAVIVAIVHIFSGKVMDSIKIDIIRQKIILNMCVIKHITYFEITISFRVNGIVQESLSKPDLSSKDIIEAGIDTQNITINADIIEKLFEKIEIAEYKAIIIKYSLKLDFNSRKSLIKSPFII